MSSPSESSTKTHTENNPQVQPSLDSISAEAQPGTGANIILIGPPGSGKNKYPIETYNKHRVFR